jgi:hypothetical protein
VREWLTYWTREDYIRTGVREKGCVRRAVPEPLRRSRILTGGGFALGPGQEFG